LAGEIALERLQSAVRQRVNSGKEPFSNQYELAGFIYDAVRPQLKDAKAEPVMGRADLLLAFLRANELDTADALRPFIDGTYDDTEQRAVVAQVIDRITQGRPALLKSYLQVERELDQQRPGTRTEQAPERWLAVGKFLDRWATLERELEPMITGDQRLAGPSVANALRSLVNQGLSKDEYVRFDQLRRLRNEVVHGRRTPEPETILSATDALQRLLERLHSLAVPTLTNPTPEDEESPSKSDGSVASLNGDNTPN
jgi:hypothetical protein